MRNIISVDVEEYFHAANLDRVIGPSKWHQFPSRVEYNTRTLLDIFSACNTKGTFFCLGHTARRHPQLVREIQLQGHEIASHGYGHRLVYELTPELFKRDVFRAKCLLEDITGEQIRGYRAPNFSVTDKTPWAYQALIEAGYQYDSSIYPIWHPRYANTSQSLEPQVVTHQQKSLFVFPLAAASISLFGKNVRLPAAGGAYWRLLPRWYTRWGINSYLANSKFPAVFYLHPWEIDAEQPKVEGLSFFTKVRHYAGSSTFPNTLSWIFEKYPASSFAEVGPEVFGAKFLLDDIDSESAESE